MTHRIASEIFDFPLPLGPTMAVIASPKVSTVLSGKDLNPWISKAFKYNGCTSIAQSAHEYKLTIYYSNSNTGIQELRWVLYPVFCKRAAVCVNITQTAAESGSILSYAQPVLSLKLRDGLRHPNAIHRRRDDAAGIAAALTAGVDAPQTGLVVCAAHHPHRRRGAGLYAGEHRLRTGKAAHLPIKYRQGIPKRSGNIVWQTQAW